MSIALGLVGIGSATALLIDPLSPIAVVGFLALIAFHLLLGWKVQGLSEAHGVASADLADLRATESSLPA